MAVDAVAICNGALLKLGANKITSLADGSVEANLCTVRYAPNRDAVLIAHPWKFAQVRATLSTPDVTAPAFDYGNYFTLPNDCLRLLEVGYPGDRWKREGAKLAYDSASVDIIYIAQITDTTKFSPSFDEALMLKLAVDLSYSIVQSITLRDQLMKEYRYELAQARSFSAQEGSSPRVYADCWLNTRY